jgi:hypothetical protein
MGVVKFLTDMGGQSLAFFELMPILKEAKAEYAKLQ